MYTTIYAYIYIYIHIIPRPQGRGTRISEMACRRYRDLCITYVDIFENIYIYIYIYVSGECTIITYEMTDKH